MDRFKYSVTPFTPIRDLIPGKSIRVPFTADLNKEEVFKCMKYGPVYRVFPTERIRVTGANFENLHRAALSDDSKEVPSNSTENTVENVIKEEPVSEDIKTDEATEENIVEESVEEKLEDNIESVEEDKEGSAETKEKEVVETSVEKPAQIKKETVTMNFNKSNKQYYQNNKHNKHH